MSWSSHGHEVHGTVEKKITTETEDSGRTVKATPDEPQFKVKSDKTGATAVHKPGALHDE
ncbi:DUF2945 domain-containing protein [Winogradskya humida]|uniref:Hypervirulence associated protein TUDOR domain-containing protein n=1 Tax=Winogradskya humida TaxID=113566 RepID=A0ABQ3ZFG6_9ACTN|nr:DUF2945 domain-containing protein [Actinoplanes humidus]GIE17305.1 hypothetical protein Ahu01nite_004070 [Actinoplanes humidus]